MPIYVFGEIDDVERNGLKKDRQMIDIVTWKMNMAAMTARMDTLMAQLRTTPEVEPIPGPPQVR